MAEGTHPAIVSDELFAAAAERIDTKSRSAGHPRKGQPVHLLSGMVRCASGHSPLSMYGVVVKGHTYYRCGYGREYGDKAATDIPGHGVTCNTREDLLMPFIERFFAERVFGPMRMDLLAKQLDQEEHTQAKQNRKTAKELQATIKAADEGMAAHVRSVEAGIDPDLVNARIAELKDQKTAAEASLAALVIDRSGDDGIAAALERLPDLTVALREADADTKRLVFDAFDLRVVYDKTEPRITVSATVSEAVADLLGSVRGLSGPSVLADPALCERTLWGWDSNPQPFG